MYFYLFIFFLFTRPRVYHRRFNERVFCTSKGISTMAVKNLEKKEIPFFFFETDHTAAYSFKIATKYELTKVFF